MNKEQKEIIESIAALDNGDRESIGRLLGISDNKNSLLRNDFSSLEEKFKHLEEKFDLVLDLVKSR